MRPQLAATMMGIGVALLALDQILGMLLEFNQDTVQATDMLLMPLGVFCLAEGGFSLWRHRATRSLRTLDKR
jgi:hypothetical protein